MDYKTIMELDPVASFLKTMWLETDDGSGDPTASGRANGQMLLDMIHAEWARAPVDLASAATTDIGAVPADVVNITGAVTITALGVAPAGVDKTVRFTGAPLLTHGASLLLPGQKSIRVAAGDAARFLSLGAGNWVCLNYHRSAQGPGLGQNWKALAWDSVASAPVTGTTAEVDMATFTMPGGTMGPKGQLRISATLSCTLNNANSKALRFRFGGQAIVVASLANALSLDITRRIANRNAQNSQITGPVASTNSFGTNTATVGTFAVDTSADVIIKFTGLLANGTDSMQLESYLIEYLYGA